MTDSLGRNPLSAFSNVLMRAKSISICLTLLACLAGVTVNAAVEPLTVNGSEVLVGGKSKALAGNGYFWSNTWLWRGGILQCRLG